MSTVTLQPIAITTPNEHCVYGYSKLRQVKTMGYEEFWSEYIDQSRRVRVCVDGTPTLGNSVEVKAYGFSYDGWYIIKSEGVD